MSETNAERAKNGEKIRLFLMKLLVRFGAGVAAASAVTAINKVPGDSSLFIGGIAAVLWTLAEEFK